MVPGGATTSTITGLGAGTYTVTATDANNGCTLTATACHNTLLLSHCRQPVHRVFPAEEATMEQLQFQSEWRNIALYYSLVTIREQELLLPDFQPAPYTCDSNMLMLVIKTSTVSIVQPALLCQTLVEVQHCCVMMQQEQRLWMLPGGTTPYSL